MRRASWAGGAGGLLRASVRGRGRQLLLFAFWSAVEAVPAALSGRLIALALDHGFLAGRGGAGFGFLALFGLTVLAGSWGTREAFLRLAVVIEPFRDELVRRAVRGSLQRSARAGAPPDSAAVARLTQQVEIVREAYASVLLVAQGFLVTAGAALVGLATLVPGATVLVLAPLGLSLAVFVLALPRLAARQREAIIADEELADVAATAIAGLRDVVACGGEDAAAQSIGARVREQARASGRVAWMSALRTLVVALGGWAPVVLILLAASRLQREGAPTGAIIGVLTYVLRGVQPALQQLVAGIGSTGLWLLVTLRRIVETAAAGEAPPVQAPAAAPRDGALRLRGVTFAYGSAADRVIDGLDLDLPDGDHLAIVGPSGAGKSTLANLAAGLLVPQQGSILLGGAPVAAMDAAELGRHRVLIPQEAYVLPATVRENLLYLDPAASAERVADALERLGAQALVSRLGGLDAVVAPDALSAGERQLLTLVRAYLAPGRLVILDEAACHLDPVAEARAEAAFAARAGTLVVIAHRISSALRARRVLVLDGPRVALGTHEQLLAASPLYRNLTGGWERGLYPRDVATAAGSADAAAGEESPSEETASARAALAGRAR